MVTASLTDIAAALARAAARLRADMAEVLRSNAGAIGRTSLWACDRPRSSVEDDRCERERAADICRQIAAEQPRPGRR